MTAQVTPHAVVPELGSYPCPFCGNLLYAPGTYWLHMLDVHNVELQNVSSVDVPTQASYLIMQMCTMMEWSEDCAVPEFDFDRFAARCGLYPEYFVIDYNDGTITSREMGELYLNRIGSTIRY